MRLQAQWLLGVLGKLGSGASALRDGCRIDVGWSVITLRSIHGNLYVHEPDYSSDPFTQLRNDVTATLRVMAEQNDLVAVVHVSGVPARFDQKIVLSTGTLEIDHVYLERSGEITPNDSGWYIGPVDEDRSQLEAIYVYQLLDTRPDLLRFLVLPKGCLVVLSGVQIESIVDGRNEDLWSSASRLRQKK
jgi:hypothetical protein